jgi:hypothetical protein
VGGHFTRCSATTWRYGVAALFLSTTLLAMPLASSPDDLAQADPGAGDNLIAIVATALFWGGWSCWQWDGVRYGRR